MGKVVVSQFVSIDGVVEAPGGGESYERGGWAFEFARGAEGNKFKFDELMGADALLLGRKTYEGFAAAWPGREDEMGFADKFNNMPKYVVSTTLKDPEWNNSHVLGDDLAAEVKRLKDEHDGDLLVNGSMTLVKALLEHGLVDQLTLMVFPLVLGGGGKKLFADDAPKQAFELQRFERSGDEGVTIQVYTPKG